MMRHSRTLAWVTTICPFGFADCGERSAGARSRATGRPPVDSCRDRRASLDEFGASSVGDRRPLRRVEPGDREVDRRDQDAEPRTECDGRVGARRRG